MSFYIISSQIFVGFNISDWIQSFEAFGSSEALRPWYRLKDWAAVVLKVVEGSERFRHCPHHCWVISSKFPLGITGIHRFKGFNEEVVSESKSESESE